MKVAIRRMKPSVRRMAIFSWDVFISFVALEIQMAYAS
jgi:hypothetical protein